MIARRTSIGTRPVGARALRRRALGRIALGALLLPVVGWPTAAGAAGVEVLTLQVERGPTIVALDFALRLTLPAAVEDALRRGVPLHFVARATLYRSRWYWRDERIGRVTRQWRLSYQPLTNSYRVSIGGLHQTFGSLDEALGTVSRLSAWRLADADDIDPGESHYVEFDWRLDTSQLPPPIQIGVGSLPEWTLELERTLPLTLP